MGKILVTGGSGFIGSHLVDRLISLGNDVVVFDNLSSGNLKNLDHQKNNFVFVNGDLLNIDDLNNVMDGVSRVYHIAANPDVRLGEANPKVHFDNNVLATFNLLESMRKNDIKKIVFMSSSTVYGDTKIIPTPENHPCNPISTYGASKLAAESLIMSYSGTFGINSTIFRLANVIGSRSNHGVIYDFIKKLKNNSKELTILGDGTQSKSYLYVSDCIEAMLFSEGVSKNEVFNLGTEQRTNVKKIADVVVDVLGLKNVKYNFTGGIGGRGWKGDVKIMQLSIDKIKSLGWKPKYNSEQSVRRTVNDLKKLF